MHLYLLARGHPDRINRWENDILSRYYPYRYKKGEPMGKVQLVPRPLRLYELVYPEEYHKDVLALLCPNDGHSSVVRILKQWFRRLVGLGPWRPKEEIKPDNNFYREFVDVVALGTKKDLRDKNGIELL